MTSLKYSEHPGVSAVWAMFLWLVDACLSVDWPSRPPWPCVTPANPAAHPGRKCRPYSGYSAA